MIPPVAGHFQGKIHVVILVWVRKDCYFLGLSAVPALPLFGSTYIVLKKKKNFYGTNRDRTEKLPAAGIGLDTR